jgi:ferredoxin
VEEKQMKIVVDRDTCQGHGRCAVYAPEVYELDDEGYCAITDLLVPADQEDAAASGADACPENAIEVID